MRPHAAGFESVQKIPRKEAKSALGYLRAFLTHSPAQPTSQDAAEGLSRRLCSFALVGTRIFLDAGHIFFF
jgi:hypothetical protein